MQSKANLEQKKRWPSAAKGYDRPGKIVFCREADIEGVENSPWDVKEKE